MLLNCIGKSKCGHFLCFLNPYLYIAIVPLSSGPIQHNCGRKKLIIKENRPLPPDRKRRRGEQPGELISERHLWVATGGATPLQQGGQTGVRLSTEERKEV